VAVEGAVVPEGPLFEVAVLVGARPVAAVLPGGGRSVDDVAPGGALVEDGLAGDGPADVVLPGDALVGAGLVTSPPGAVVAGGAPVRPESGRFELRRLLKVAPARIPPPSPLTGIPLGATHSPVVAISCRSPLQTASATTPTTRFRATRTASRRISRRCLTATVPLALEPLRASFSWFAYR
jgi:hypothetical protein